jgi:predicted transcriptional regulator
LNSEIKDLEKGKKDLLEKYKELELEKDEMTKHAKTLKAEVVSKEVEVIRSKGEKEDSVRRNKQLIEVLKSCNGNTSDYSTS